jgi:isopentenyldiphosphate isomerase
MKKYSLLCVVANEKKEVLLLKRSLEKKDFAGQWFIVAAGPYQSPVNLEKDAYSELKEEVGCDQSKVINFRKIHVQDSVVNGIKYEAHIFLVNTKDFQVTMNHEHTEYKWVSKENLAKYDLPRNLPDIIKRDIN